MFKEEAIKDASEVPIFIVAEQSLKPGDQIIVVGAHDAYVFEIIDEAPMQQNAIATNCTRLGRLNPEGFIDIPLDAVWRIGDLIQALFLIEIEKIYLKISNCDLQPAKQENVVSSEDSATLLSPSELPPCWPEGHGACKVLNGGNGHYYLCDSSRNDEMVFHVYCWDEVEFAQMEEKIKNYP
jgi:hypothetical protein